MAITGKMVRLGVAGGLAMACLAPAFSVEVATVLPAAAANTPTPSSGGSASSPSAVGDASVTWLAVSPGYQRTGLVVAMVTPFTNSKCNSNCTQLWVTHNGGASWSVAAAKGWNQGRPSVAYDGKGHDTLFSAGSSGLQRSDDGGASWTQVAPSGTAATASPSYASDGSVAVAGGNHDFVLKGTQSQAVTGSGGAYSDYVFSYTPSFPDGGAAPPALLSAIDSHGLPVVLQCDRALACHGAASLPGAATFSAPVYLATSSDFADDRVVFAQSGRGVYKSTNGGTSFTQLPVTGTAGATATTTPALALAPGYREGGPVRTVYVSVFQIFTDTKNPHTGGGVYRSDDGGVSWSAVGSPSPMDGGSMSMVVAPDGRLFAGYVRTGNYQTTGGLLCSTDGKVWVASCPSVGSGDAWATSSKGGAAGGNASCSTCTTNNAPGAASTPASAGINHSNGQAAANGSDGAGDQKGVSPAVSTGAKRGSSVALPLIALAAVLAALALGGAIWTRRKRGA